MSTFYLYESAPGFTLFQCDTIDETNINTKPIQKQIADFATFAKICHLRVSLIPNFSKAFTPFQTSDVALANSLAIQSGQVTQELVDFLSQNLPPVGKKNR